MTIDATSLRSRRSLIAGAAGGIAALVATAIRPLRVAAFDDSEIFTNDESNVTVLAARSIKNGPGTGAGVGLSGQSSSGIGVQGGSPGGTGVKGTSQSGAGVAGYSNIAPGVLGSGTANYGVRGISQNGRGGSFRGGAAQLRLEPSGFRTHPEAGLPGDLVMDKDYGLWFCKGGKTWVRLA